MIYHHDFTKTLGTATKLTPNSAYLGAVLDTPSAPPRRLSASWRICPRTGRPILRWSTGAPA